MSQEMENFADQALKLPPRERAALAHRLIASLDALDVEENESLWLEEAERRYEEYKKGNISAKTAEDVLREARGSIK